MSRDIYTPAISHTTSRKGKETTTVIRFGGYEIEIQMNNQGYRKQDLTQTDIRVFKAGEEVTLQFSRDGGVLFTPLHLFDVMAQIAGRAASSREDQ